MQRKDMKQKLGYWTRQCEDWFQAWLWEIHDGGKYSKPFTASRWTTMLHFNHNNPQFIQASKVATELFLVNEVYSPYHP